MAEKLSGYVVAAVLLALLVVLYERLPEMRALLIFVTIFAARR